MFCVETGITLGNALKVMTRPIQQMLTTFRKVPNVLPSLKGPWSDAVNLDRPPKTIAMIGSTYDRYIPIIAMDKIALKAVVLPRYINPSRSWKHVMVHTALDGICSPRFMVLRKPENGVASSRAKAHSVREVDVRPAIAPARAMIKMKMVRKDAPTCDLVTSR